MTAGDNEIMRLHRNVCVAQLGLPPAGCPWGDFGDNDDEASSQTAEQTAAPMEVDPPTVDAITVAEPLHMPVAQLPPSTVHCRIPFHQRHDWLHPFLLAPWLAQRHGWQRPCSPAPWFAASQLCSAMLDSILFQ